MRRYLALRPHATLGLALVCVVVFLYQLTLSNYENGRFVYQTGLIPARLFGGATMPPGLDGVPALATLLTSMFVHSGVAHILLNMIVFISFGILVERALGPARYLALFFLSGVAGGLLQCAIAPSSEAPIIGASGAISGVLAAAFVAAPRMRILLIVVPMPFYVAIAIILALHVLFVVTGWEAGVAWWAHLGGFAVGLTLYPLMGGRRLDRAV